MPAVPDGACATELLADDIAASVQQADLGSAHVSGLSPAPRPPCGWLPSTLAFRRRHSD